MNKKINLEQFITSVFTDLPLSDRVLEGFLTALPKNPVPEAIRERLIQDLRQARRETIELNDKVRNPNKNNTLGELVTNMRQKREIDVTAAAAEMKVPGEILDKIEHNSIAMPDVSIRHMSALIGWLMVTIDDAFNLIRKSQSMYKLGSVYSGISARYDRKETASVRDASMASAYRELQLQSRKSRKIKDEEIESYILSLKKALRGT